jgi:hypothetical protein
VIAYRIETTDLASPALQQLRGALAPSRLNPIVGTAAAEATVAHFVQLNRERPNRLGGRRTNYYFQASEKVNWREIDDGVVISIPQVGLALRVFGGTVRPKQKKFLTIPVNPAAHGKRASEFDLEVIFGRGGEPIALGRKTRVKKGQNPGALREIMFRLAKHAIQRPDPTVAPSAERITASVTRAVDNYIGVLIARAGSTTS